MACELGTFRLKRSGMPNFKHLTTLLLVPISAHLLQKCFSFPQTAVVDFVWEFKSMQFSEKVSRGAEGRF